ncbi:MAG: TauD/TfdA family dioxygenase [Halieaceae bacterium]|jgi:taurine dioxygenase|nr:TauD/TfdA family dioxygenase [Halieaceae bacterium]
MPLTIEATGEACGARVRGLDFAKAIDGDVVAQLRSAWLEHQVLIFPEQSLSDDDLERFTGYFGPFGDDPFIAPIPGRQHVIAVARRADESGSIFADVWHTDWSFQEKPPIGTCLYGIDIPPQGGNTLFANQYLALEAMPAALRERIRDRKAIHSAKLGYSPSGLYGDADAAADRSMTITPSAEAEATQLHAFIREHDETGRATLYGCIGYIIGAEGLDDEAALELLLELHAWQTREEFVYEHEWEEGTLLMWDNRCLLHRATGGYEGYDRLLHRTTIGAG